MFLQKLTRSILLGLTLSFGGNVANASPGLEPPWGSAAYLQHCPEGTGLYICSYERLERASKSMDRTIRSAHMYIERLIPEYGQEEIDIIHAVLSLDDEALATEIIGRADVFHQAHFFPMRYRMQQAIVRNAHNAARYLLATWEAAEEYCVLEGHDPELMPECEFINSHSIEEIRELQEYITVANEELNTLFMSVFEQLNISLDEF